jgi:hypothetical protein
MNSEGLLGSSSFSDQDVTNGANPGVFYLIDR